MRIWQPPEHRDVHRLWQFASPVKDTYQPLDGQRIFTGDGIAILAWTGNKGASMICETPYLVPRKEYASVSIVVRGAFKMTETPDGSDWPLLLPGDIGNDVSPDFIPGYYRYSAMEDNSVEFCCGGVDSKERADNGRFGYKHVLPGAFVVPKGSILIAATGSVSWEGVVRVAPTIIHAAQQDRQIHLQGEGLWIART